MEVRRRPGARGDCVRRGAGVASILRPGERRGGVRRAHVAVRVAPQGRARSDVHAPAALLRRRRPTVRYTVLPYFIQARRRLAPSTSLTDRRFDCCRPAGERPAHMEALVQDSVAFALASLAIMAVQLAAASAAVTLANWAAARMVSTPILITFTN